MKSLTWAQPPRLRPPHLNWLKLVFAKHAVRLEGRVTACIVLVGLVYLRKVSPTMVRGGGQPKLADGSILAVSPYAFGAVHTTGLALPNVSRGLPCVLVMPVGYGSVQPDSCMQRKCNKGWGVSTGSQDCCGTDGGFCGEYSSSNPNEWISTCNTLDFIRVSPGCGIEVNDHSPFLSIRRLVNHTPATDRRVLA